MNITHKFRKVNISLVNMTFNIIQWLFTFVMWYINYINYINK